MPSYSGCNVTNPSFGSNRTFAPPSGSSVYVICNGMNASGSGTITFNPGIYIFDRGTVNISGSFTIKATGGVTLIFTSSTGSSYATFRLDGSSNVTLNAPTTGPTSGVALWIDKNSTSSLVIDGSQILKYTGAIYAPNAATTLTGSSTSTCTQMIVKTLLLDGSQALKHDCSGYAVRDVGTSVMTMVE